MIPLQTIMSERVYCIVCGTPISWEEGWPTWMRQFRAGKHPEPPLPWLRQ